MSQIVNRAANGPLGLTANGGSFQTSTDVSLATLVGTKWDTSDGRELILVSTPAATTVAAGYFYSDAALVSTSQGLTVSAFTAASVNGNVPASFTVTSGSSAAVAANVYQGGFVTVVSSTGIGQTLRIAGNTAATSAGSYLFTVTLEDNPAVALSTTSVVNLSPAHGANIIISPAAASLTNAEAGVGLYVIAPSSYGFLVSRGLTSVVAVAAGIAVGNVTVGAGGAGVIFSGVLSILGYNPTAIAASSAGLVYVML